jgi:hypothetical protein
VLHGIGLYGSAEVGDCDVVQGNYGVSVKVYPHERYGHILSQISRQVQDSVDFKNGRVFKVPFKKPVQLCSGIWYTVAAMIDVSYMSTTDSVKELLNKLIRLVTDAGRSIVLRNGWEGMC